MPRIRPHPGGRRPAPRVLPVLDRAVVLGLRARARLERPGGRRGDGQPRRREAGEPAHDDHRRERLLLLRRRAQDHLPGDGVGGRLPRHGDAAGGRAGADDAELHVAAADGLLRLLLPARDDRVHGGGQCARPHGRRRGDLGPVAVPVPVLRAGVHDRVRLDERACELPRAQHVAGQRVASGEQVLRTRRSTGSGTTCSWTRRQPVFAPSCSARLRTGGSWSSGGTSASSATRRGGSTSTSCCSRTARSSRSHRNRADDGRERGNSATLGIENATGTVGLQFSFNQAVLDVEPAVTSIRYRPPA